MKRFVLLLLLICLPLNAATISATGSWSNSLSSANLVAGAGTDLVSTLTSTSNVITVDVTNAPVVGNYRVYARVSSGVPAGVTIAVKRTTDGDSLLPLALIAGGSSYITLSTTDTEIFYGALDRYNIALQLRATGVSVGITPATYTPNIILSVTP